MSKFTFTAYRQLSSPEDVAKGFWSVEPLNPIGRVQIICDFMDFSRELKNFALVNAGNYKCQVIALGDVAYGQRAPNGWKKFEAARKNQIIVNPGE